MVSKPFASIEIVDSKENMAKGVPRDRDGNTVVNFFDRTGKDNYTHKGNSNLTSWQRSYEISC